MTLTTVRALPVFKALIRKKSEGGECRITKSTLYLRSFSSRLWFAGVSSVRNAFDFTSNDEEENPKRKRQKVLDREVPQ